MRVSRVSLSTGGMRWKVVVAVLAFANVLVSAELLTPHKLVNDITLEGLESNLWELNRIAKENGGNRAFGLPGYTASKDFLLEKIGRYEYVDSWEQSFTEWFTQTFNITLNVADDVGPMDIVTFTGTTATPNGGPITADLVVVPINDVSGTGCLESDWAEVDVDGKIAIIKRGLCTFGSKAKFAKKFGAVGALIWNNVETPVTGGTLGPKDEYAPVGLISLADGQTLVDRVAAGGLKATLLVDAIGEYRETWNVIAETQDGDPENVIVLGAHLDSVQLGPGINDDGSGSTALIELLYAIKHYTFKNKVRFIWWGAEESGLLGSYHYTEKLTVDEIADIALYLNFDMIASPDAFYGVFDGDGSTHGFLPAPGSGHIESLFTEFLTSPPYNLEVTPASFSNGSDYVGFVDIGVPVGGLYTGTPPQDNCYHLACDDINNVNWKVLETNTKAAAYVLGTLASDLKGIPGRKERAARVKRNPSLARRVRREDSHDHGHEHEHGKERSHFASCEHHEHTLL